MKFTGKLDPATQRLVAQCDERLNDAARLTALERTGLMDSPCEQAFDRLAQLAARILGVPLTMQHGPRVGAGACISARISSAQPASCP